MEVQFSPIHSILIEYLNKDSIPDFIMSGNMYETEVETVRYDAGRGVCLIGDGKGNFAPLTLVESGFFASDNVKSMKKIHVKNQKILLLGINNRKINAFKLN